MRTFRLGGETNFLLDHVGFIPTALMVAIVVRNTTLFSTKEQRSK